MKSIKKLTDNVKVKARHEISISMLCIGIAIVIFVAFLANHSSSPYRAFSFGEREVVSARLQEAERSTQETQPSEVAEPKECFMTAVIPFGSARAGDVPCDRESVWAADQEENGGVLEEDGRPSTFLQSLREKGYAELQHALTVCEGRSSSSGEQAPHDAKRCWEEMSAAIQAR
jgi:hypothetical protein